VVDWQVRGRLDRGTEPANAKVLNELDADGFFALLTERLARLPL
jgi:inosine-uridine nucleoside N-ribohydrolase